MYGIKNLNLCYHIMGEDVPLFGFDDKNGYESSKIIKINTFLLQVFLLLQKYLNLYNNNNMKRIRYDSRPDLAENSSPNIFLQTFHSSHNIDSEETFLLSKSEFRANSKGNEI